MLCCICGAMIATTSQLQSEDGHTSSAMIGTPIVVQSFKIFLCTLDSFVIELDRQGMEAPDWYGTS